MDHHSKGKVSWVMAYVCMPFFLAIVCGILLYFGLKPVALGLLHSTAPMMNAGEGYFVDGSPKNVLNDKSSRPAEGLADSSAEDGAEEEKQVIEEPNIGDQYGQLVCERLDIHSPVYFGDNPDVLLMGIGTYPVSWIPGCGRTTLMSGHNDMSLATLGDVQVGDCFTLTTDYGTFEYQVSDFKIVDETDVDACRLEETKEQLVLYTCYPFYKISGRRTERFFVYLEKISGPEIELIHYFLKD